MCGIFGVFGASKAAELTAIGLHGMQHRAITFAGMVASDGKYFYRERGEGVVRQVFSSEMLTRLHGLDALGHIRYPTVADDLGRDNIQPIVGTYNGKPIAIAHNGNLTNVEELSQTVPADKRATSMDTEYILRLLEAGCTGNIEADLMRVFEQLEGSFSLGILLPDRLIAIRDKSGNRPLCIGRDGESYFVSSETCALPSVGATLLYEVEPGTMISIDKYGTQRTRFAKPELHQCSFEWIYYAHPASVVFGKQVSRIRLEIGQRLEELFPVPNADIVTPVPDSSNFIAMGFGQSLRSGIFWPVIFRSHYVGRSFIAVTQAKRDKVVASKFTFSAADVEGKIVVIVDDSIVRGTTLPIVVAKLRELGAREIHVRIGSPPIKHPCIYGIDTPLSEDLIAARIAEDEICRKAGADSLKFLPLDVLKEITGEPDSFSYSCMNGEYW